MYPPTHKIQQLDFYLFNLGVGVFLLKMNFYPVKIFKVAMNYFPVARRARILGAVDLEAL